MDVEQLNERLEVKGADRIRHSGIAPDEAHGVRLLPLFFLSFSLSLTLAVFLLPPTLS